VSPAPRRSLLWVSVGGPRGRCSSSQSRRTADCTETCSSRTRLNPLGRQEERQLGCSYPSRTRRPKTPSRGIIKLAKEHRPGARMSMATVVQQQTLTYIVSFVSIHCELQIGPPTTQGAASSTGRFALSRHRLSEGTPHHIFRRVCYGTAGLGCGKCPGEFFWSTSSFVPLRSATTVQWPSGPWKKKKREPKREHGSTLSSLSRSMSLGFVPTTP
jgi:hypothetical protein